MLFSEIPTNPFHPHDIAALDAIGRAGAHKTMMKLKLEGWVEETPDERWALTPDGLKEAEPELITLELAGLEKPQTKSNNSSCSSDSIALGI